jgi:hypothetical protein
MKVEAPELTLKITLDSKEIKWLMNISQNALGDETEQEKEIRKAFFVTSARALGYDINNNGTFYKSQLPQQ